LHVKAEDEWFPNRNDSLSDLCQGDRIGRIFATWAIVFLGHFLENYGSSRNLKATFSSVLILTKMVWSTFWAIFSPTHRVTLLFTISHLANLWPPGLSIVDYIYRRHIKTSKFKIIATVAKKIFGWKKMFTHWAKGNNSKEVWKASDPLHDQLWCKKSPS
jgi:hypothetical protein